MTNTAASTARRPYRVQFFDRWESEWVTIATFASLAHAKQAKRDRAGLPWYRDTSLRIKDSTTGEEL